MDIVTGTKILTDIDSVRNAGKNRLVVYYGRDDTLPVGLLSAISSLKEKPDFREMPFSNTCMGWSVLMGMLLSELHEFVLITAIDELLSMGTVSFTGEKNQTYTVHIVGTVKEAVETANGSMKRRTKKRTVDKGNNVSGTSSDEKKKTIRRKKAVAEPTETPAAENDSSSDDVQQKKSIAELSQSDNFAMNPPVVEKSDSFLDLDDDTENASKEEFVVLSPTDSVEDESVSAEKSNRKRKQSNESTGLSFPTIKKSINMSTPEDFQKMIVGLGVDGNASEKIRELLLDCDKASDMEKLFDNHIDNAKEVAKKLASQFESLKKLAKNVETSFAYR